MKNTLLFLVMFMGIFVITGCRSSSSTGIKSNSPFHSSSFGKTARVQIEGILLNATVNVDRVETQRVEGDLLKIYVVFRNTGSRGKWIKTRTTFLDSSNHKLEQTNWEPIFIDRRNVVEYTCTSLSSKASDFQVLVYENK